MRFLIGDLFSSDASVLVNTVNCVGVMGKGIAAAFKKRFPDNYIDYKKRCARNELRPGHPYLFKDPSGISIINFPTKDHWRSPSRMSFVEEGLDWFVANWSNLGIDSVAFPPLGCGNGGLAWEDVGVAMYNKLASLPIDISAYAPYGTPKTQLSTAFFEKKQTYCHSIGKYRIAYNKKWDLVLKVIQSLDDDLLSLSVGRTAYQKICYVLTRFGVMTGFVFRKGEYGPFSEEARDALAIMANCNYIQEDSLGTMIRIRPSDSFTFQPERFTASELGAVEKTVDLFSRIRNSEQAEDAATLIFAHDRLRAEGTCVSEDQILRYVLDWKPRWKNSAKVSALKRELFFLASLGLIGIQQLTYRPVDEF